MRQNDPPMPSTRHRLLVALAAAVLAMVVASIKARQWGYIADFSVFWFGAVELVQGRDPYALQLTTLPGFRFDSGFLYPLPAAVVLAPFALVPLWQSGLLFVGLSMGALAWALTRESWDRWPILLSFPALWSVGSGQWAPLVTAAALSPSFAWAAACKPTLGIAAFLRNPSWRFVWIGAVPVVIASFLMPDWPYRWRVAVEGAPAGNYHIPLLQPFGFLLLGALARWRDPDARLLLGMSVVPQTFLVYDQLPLLLLARTRTQSYLFSLYSYLSLWGAVYAMQSFGMDAPSKAQSLVYLARATTWLWYLPLLAFVLSPRRSCGPVAISPTPFSSCS